jgi:hypothetical protein
MATQAKQSGCGTIVLGAIALFFLYKMLSCNNTPGEPEKIDEGKAYSVSHEFVKAKLKSPSTADFGNYIPVRP